MRDLPHPVGNTARTSLAINDGFYTFVHCSLVFKIESPTPRLRRTLSKTSSRVLFDRDEAIKLC